MLTKLCKALQLPSLAQTATEACQQAERQHPSYSAFLEELLRQEYADKQQRRTVRLVKEATFPRIKSFEGFDFSRNSLLPEGKLRNLATGTYIPKAEPIIFLGEPGTGKTHLASALGYYATQQGHTVKFVTACQLATQLMEAKNNQQLSLLMQRYRSYKVLILDELGYVPLTVPDAELLFQIISQRHENYPIIITTNLPFGEWTTIFNDHRLCKALIDRITYQAHIIETGEHSLRFEHSLAKLKREGKMTNTT